MATKSSSKRKTVRSTKSSKTSNVDFEPNKMAIAVATLAAVILMLLALITAL